MNPATTFQPIHVVEHDLVRERQTSTTLANGDIARVLVRLSGRPVGFVEFQLDDASEFEAQLARAISRELHAPLRSALEELSVAPSLADDPAALRRHLADERRDTAPGITGAPVTVVVSTRDRPESLERCLRSLATLTYQRVEVFVVDNAPSGTETYDLVMRIRPELERDGLAVSYLVEPNPGLSHGRNCGLAHSRTDIVAFTDDDVEVDPGWVSALVVAFDRDPDAGCVTGLVPTAKIDTIAHRHFDRRVDWSTNCERRRYTLVSANDVSRSHPFATGVMGTGANFALRRSSMADVGTFDVGLGAGSPTRGGEDLDMFLRVMLAGCAIIYEPAAIVWHHHRTDDGALRSQLFAYGLGLSAYLAKHAFAKSTFGRMIGRVPSGAHRFLAARRSNLGADLPARLVAAETAGMLVGPAVYLRGRLRTRVPRRAR